MNKNTDKTKASPNPNLPTQGCLLAIDFGTVRVGIAYCDERQTIASPYETYTRRNAELDARYFLALAEETNAVGFVVGLPLHMSGDESQKSEESREFGLWLSELTELPVDWIDERYSTAFAKEILSTGKLSAKKRKERLDKIAAQTILSAYLENPIDPANARSIDG